MSDAVRKETAEARREQEIARAQLEAESADGRSAGPEHRGTRGDTRSASDVRCTKRTRRGPSSRLDTAQPAS